MDAATSTTLRALEWERFVGFAEAEARTEPGRARLRELLSSQAWARDIAGARLLQQQMQETMLLLDRDALWGPILELADPRDLLERLGRGAVLEVRDLTSLRGWLYAFDSWSQMPRDEVRGEAFKKALQTLMDPFEPLRVLEKILSPEGELSERASPRLAQLHAEIRSLKQEISRVLDQLLKSFAQKGVLQESFTDVRDGRYVLPVKISAQSEVEGTIYEASASRQTVFVEPREIAPLNNRLRQRQNDLVQEIYEILSAASKALQPFAGEIESSVAVLAYWDSVQARARLGRRYAGKPIHVTEERSFLLHQTAHPLLWWSMQVSQIVRNEVDFGEPIRTLLITGPNTGGKTVLLKTLGLAGICARTGFPLPATEHPVVPFFDSFFADLGDPQSIEQHLSSFSGHVYRFKEILESVSDRSLVLIDELNSATDPEEGAALGRAFLETVMGRGALVVTTTHDPHLKAIALSDERIMNASMAFDEASRAPTFRMVLGVPGRSRALETAERLGIPNEVLELARGYLSREHNEFERMLERLESEIQDAARARKDAVALRDEAERLKKEWTERTEASVGEMMERARQRLRRVVELAQDEVRLTVRKLDEAASRREIDQTRARLNETLTQSASQMDTALREEAPEIIQALELKKPKPTEAAETTPSLAPGARVRVPKWKAAGTVVEAKGSKIKVALGTMQITLSPEDVEPIAGGASPPKPATRIVAEPAVATPPPELDLRGKRYDDAMAELEHYLDQAFRSGGRVEVTVIHGLGTGALREGTRQTLSKLPYVKNYRDGGAGHGGAGATVVEFDRD